MSLPNNLNLWRDYDNSPTSVTFGPTLITSSARSHFITKIHPISTYANTPLHIPLEAILHYDFLEQDQFIAIFEARIEKLTRWIEEEKAAREVRFQKKLNRNKRNDKKVARRLRRQARNADDERGAGKLNDRERLLRKKRNCCQERLVLCKSLFAQKQAFPFDKLPLEIRCMILGYLVSKPDSLTPAQSLLTTSKLPYFRISKSFTAAASYSFLTLNTFNFRNVKEIVSMLPKVKPAYIALIRKVFFSWDSLLQDAEIEQKAAQLLDSLPTMNHLTIRSHFDIPKPPWKSYYTLDEPIFQSLLKIHELKQVNVIPVITDVHKKENWSLKEEEKVFLKEHLEGVLRERLVPLSDEYRGKNERTELIRERLAGVGEVAGTRIEKIKLEWNLRHLGFERLEVAKEIDETGYDSQKVLANLELKKALKESENSG